jgi:O-antigen/teichoic acid export membrane protein
VLGRLGKDIVTYGMGDFVFRLIAFAVFPIYAHVFSVDEFGVMALIGATAGLLAQVANVGLNNAVQRFYWDPKTEEAVRPLIVSTGLSVLCVWSVILISATLAGLYPVRYVIQERYAIEWMIILLGLSAVVSDQLVQYALDTIRLHFSPWEYTLVSFLKNLFGVGIGLVLILGFSTGLVGVFWGALFGSLFALPVALFLIRQDLSRKLDASIAKELLAYGYPFIFAGMAYWVFGSMDRWMLAELSNNTEVGLYSIAFKFATIVLFLNTAFGQAWSPMAIKIRRDDLNYRQVYSELLSGWFLVLVIIGATVAFFGYELLYILTPPEYWTAAAVLGPLVMGIVLSGTTQITALGISLERKTRLFATGAWVTAGVNFGLNWMLIPRWGALGAATATLVSYAVFTGFLLFWTQRLHPIPLEKIKLAYCVLLVGLTVIASIYMNELSWSVGLLVAKTLIVLGMVFGAFWLRIIEPSVVSKIWRIKKWA